MFSLLSKFGSLNFGFPRAITTRRRFAAPANLNSKALEELVGVPKPKRPVTGYLKFATEQRPTLVKENPSLSVPEIAKLTAEKWRATDDSLKKRYSLEYEEEKKKYQSALNAYSSALAKVNPSDIALLEEKMKKDRRLLQKVMERRTLRKRKAELGQPKKPVSPYLLFIQDRRSEQGSQPYKEVPDATQLSKEMKIFHPLLAAALNILLQNPSLGAYVMRKIIIFFAAFLIFTVILNLSLGYHP